MEHLAADDGTDLLELTQALNAALSSDGSSLASGDCLGNYILDHCLGEGGMGSIWLADQIEPVRRQVAIKLSRKRRMTRHEIDLFMLERQALARMNHPAIGQIFDAGALDDGTPFFIMEYVHGSTLATYCAQQALSVNERVELMRKVCLGIEHAHQKGVLHCDLKPSNIVVTEIDGKAQPKIIDFGTAQLLGREKVQPSMYGTLAYLAPEQADPGANLDTRTDVHALGLILYELLAGERLRKNLSTRDDLSVESLQAALARPSNIALPARLAGERLPAWRRRELQAIVVRATQVEAECRFGSAGALAAELDAWLRQVPVESIPGTRRYRVGCFLRRNRLLSALSFAFMVIIGALLWSLALQLEQTRHQRDRAEQVVDMMMDMFRFADPYRYPGGSITVRDLLKQSADRLLARPLDSSTRIHLLTTLGEVQEVLEIHADAALTFERIQTLGEELGSPPEQIDQAGLQRARNVAYAEDMNLALVQTEALVQRSIQRNDSQARFSALLLQAEILDYLSRSEEAMASMASANALLPMLAGPEPSLQWLHLRGKMDAYVDSATSIEALQEALDLARRLYGDSDKITLTILSDMAVALSRAGHYEEAVAHSRELVGRTEDIWGEDSTALAIVLDNMAVQLQRIGGSAEILEAIAQHERALRMFEQLSGPDSMHVSVAANNLGTALARMNRHEEAVSHFELALTGVGSAWGPENARVGIVSNNLARSLIAQGELERAGTLLSSAAVILEQALGEDHPRHAVLRISEAEWLIQMGRHPAAAEALDSAEAIILANFGSRSDEYQRLQKAKALLPSATSP